MVSAVKLSELRYWLRQPGMVVFLLAVHRAVGSRRRDRDPWEMVDDMTVLLLVLRIATERHRARRDPNGLPTGADTAMATWNCRWCWSAPSAHGAAGDGLT
jgi:hypothetical protein